jgi:hypothetical protein
MEIVMAREHAVYRETSERKLVAMGGRFGFAWITGMFFVVSLAGHWLFGWFAYINEQRVHGQPIEMSEYVVQMSRDTLELRRSNWRCSMTPSLSWHEAPDEMHPLSGHLLGLRDA